jgi:hypothetical protein
LTASRRSETWSSDLHTKTWSLNSIRLRSRDRDRSWSWRLLRKARRRRVEGRMKREGLLKVLLESNEVAIVVIAIPLVNKCIHDLITIEERIRFRDRLGNGKS